MHRVLLVGAGQIGRTIVRMLLGTRDYEVRVVDVDDAALAALPTVPRLEALRFDATDETALRDAMVGMDSVVAALPPTFAERIATTALDAGLSYFDLGDERRISAAIRALAGRCRDGRILMPQCGLAPGFVSMLGRSLADRLDSVDALSMRVGALPIYPTNSLGYALTWSTEGLLAAYCEPCEVLVDGELRDVPALEGLEEIAIDGVRYEAFHTSGGVGTLARTLEGRVRALDYKTLRYPGHRDRMMFLLRDLRLSARRELLAELLEQAVPTTTQDVVVVQCVASGQRGGQLVQLTDVRRLHGRKIDGEATSAIQVASAAAVCAVLDLHVARLLPRTGAVTQESVPLELFCGGRFGRYFDVARPVPLPETSRLPAAVRSTRHG